MKVTCPACGRRVDLHNAVITNLAGEALMVFHVIKTPRFPKECPGSQLSVNAARAFIADHLAKNAEGK